MKKQQDDIEEIIKRELYNEADEARREVELSETEEIPEEVKADIRLKMQERIDAYEKEQTYARLSKEDKEALELGRKIQNNQNETQVIYRRRRGKMYAILAAALMLALAVGITSMGGAEKITSILEQFVGGRKVVKVNSDEENKVVENEDEEAAYQEIKEAFGVEPVKLVKLQKGIKFAQMELDESLQMAELLYKYNNQNIMYIISAGYYSSSLGFDIEDEVVDKEEVEINGVNIELTVYQIDGTNESRCSAYFIYQKLEYFLVADMDKKEFEKIIKNLYFL